MGVKHKAEYCIKSPLTLKVVNVSYALLFFYLCMLILFICFKFFCFFFALLFFEELQETRRVQPF